MKSFGDKLGRQEKAKQGNFWDWIKSNVFALVLWWGICALRGLGRGNYFDIPKVCYCRCIKTIGLIKVKIDFCQGRF